MPEVPQPPELDRIVSQFRADIAAVGRSIDRELAELVARWPENNRPVRVARLAEFQRNLAALSASAEQIVRAQTPAAMASAFELGAWGSAVAAGTVATFSAVDVAAVARVAQDTMGELLRATAGVSEMSKLTVRTLTGAHLRDAVVTGRTAQAAAVKLAADLRSVGAMSADSLTAVTYANGRAVPMTQYAEMVMRTKTAQVYQEGGFVQGRQLGVKWWEIMDGPDCGLSYHEDPTLADGLIVDTDTAERFPISHPNCRRVTTPRLDLETADDAAKARPTATDEQRLDNAAANRARDDYVRRNPSYVRLERQVARELENRAAAGGQSLATLPRSTSTLTRPATPATPTKPATPAKPRTPAKPATTPAAPAPTRPMNTPTVPTTTPAVQRAQAAAARANPAPVPGALPDGVASLPRIAGGAETAADAVKSTNPLWRQRRDYNVNCTYCSNAVELRARGFDVAARPAVGMTGRFDAQIARDWVDRDGNTRVMARLFSEDNASRFQVKRVAAKLDEATADWPEGARGFIDGNYKGPNGGGHIWNLEKRGGKLVHVDGQSGEVVDGFERLARFKPDQLRFMRTDDLVPTRQVLDTVSASTPAAPPLPNTYGIANTPAKLAAVMRMQRDVDGLRELRDALAARVARAADDAVWARNLRDDVAARFGVDAGFEWLREVGAINRQADKLRAHLAAVEAEARRAGIGPG